MTKEFIPYKQALALKELGFDEECLDKYIPTSQKLDSDMETWGEFYPESAMIPAPLYQQAFRWFRDEYDLFISIDHYENGYSINDLRRFDTYEEAELEYLLKLIEIVKQK